jgi:hypothetical protein
MAENSLKRTEDFNPIVDRVAEATALGSVDIDVNPSLRPVTDITHPRLREKPGTRLRPTQRGKRLLAGLAIGATLAAGAVIENRTGVVSEIATGPASQSTELNESQNSHIDRLAASGSETAQQIKENAQQ